MNERDKHCETIARLQRLEKDPAAKGKPEGILAGLKARKLMSEWGLTQSDVDAYLRHVDNPEPERPAPSSGGRRRQESPPRPPPPPPRRPNTRRGHWADGWEPASRRQQRERAARMGEEARTRRTEARTRSAQEPSPNATSSRRRGAGRVAHIGPPIARDANSEMLVATFDMGGNQVWRRILLQGVCYKQDCMMDYYPRTARARVYGLPADLSSLADLFNSYVDRIFKDASALLSSKQEYLRAVASGYNNQLRLETDIALLMSAARKKKRATLEQFFFSFDPERDFDYGD